MEGRVIEYRPSHGGGLDYHNSPLIGEIPTTDLYHVHRSIDQLRSLNERGGLNHIMSGGGRKSREDYEGAANLSSSLIIFAEDYENRPDLLKSSPSSSSAIHNNNNSNNNNNNNANENQHHHHQPPPPPPQQQQQSNNNGYHEDIVNGDVSALIDEQNDKIDSVLKHEVDSVYHPSSMSPSPPPAAITDGRGRKKGSKKVRTNKICTKFRMMLSIHGAHSRKSWYVVIM